MSFKWISTLWISFAVCAAGYSDSALARDEKITLRVSPNREITLSLRIPDRTPKDTRLPVLMIFGGFQQAAYVLNLIATEDPVILASFDYPFDAPRKFTFPSSLTLLPDAKRMLHWTREGIRLSLESLRSRPDVDTRRISILGASLGAPFALLGASDSPDDFRGVIIVHGFADPARTISHQLQRKWEKQYGGWSSPLAWALGRLAWSYADLPDPETCVRRLTGEQRLLIINARKDSLLPEGSGAELKVAAEASAVGGLTVLETSGGHLQPGKRKLLSELLEHVTEWMRTQRLL